MQEQQEILQVRALLSNPMRRAPVNITSIQKTRTFKTFYAKAQKTLSLNRASLSSLNSLYVEALRIYA